MCVYIHTSAVYLNMYIYTSELSYLKIHLYIRAHEPYICVVNGCRALLDVRRDFWSVCWIFLNVCRALLSVCRALLNVCWAFWNVCTTPLNACRALLNVCWALLNVCRAVLNVCRAYLDVLLGSFERM